MIALLRYAFLKGLRDRSLPIFSLMMPAQILAMLIGQAVLRRELQYPLRAFDWNDGDVFAIAILFPSFVATFSAFWTFRSEVATKAIGSFIIASRPVTVVLALISFAAATATGGLIITAVIVAVLTAGLPANIGLLALVGMISSLLGASLGALYVTISPQPTTLAWAFVAGIPLGPWIFNDPSPSRLLMITSLVSMLCVVVSTFLVRRRCAT